MRVRFLFVLGAAIGLAATASQAQAQLNGNDRLLLYYNYYQNQQNSRQILQNQNRIRTGVQDFQKIQNQQIQRDPIERYVNEPLSAQRQRPLPRIYSGQVGGAQYFMRINQFGTQFPNMR